MKAFALLALFLAATVQAKPAPVVDDILPSAAEMCLLYRELAAKPRPESEKAMYAAMANRECAEADDEAKTGKHVAKRPGGPR